MNKDNDAQLKPITINDIEECAELLIKTYNCEPWNNHWSPESSNRYLKEFLQNDRFAGYKLTKENKTIGAVFCHEKTWWTNDELFIDELFIDPEFQNQGYGKLLLQKLSQIIKDKNLAGFTLLTNRYMPALNFYDKLGFNVAEHVVFMYKEIK